MQSVCEKNGISPNVVVSMWGAVLDKEKNKECFYTGFIGSWN